MTHTAEKDAIERWADDHFTQGEVAVVMRLVEEFGWRPPGAEKGLRDRIVAVLRAEGGEPGNSLHSWRCEHPDRYGECDCLEQTADEIIRVLPPERGAS